MNILSVKNLKKYFQIKKIFQKPLIVRALDDVSFELEKGKTLAVVGESGCGKTTLAKVLLQIEKPTDGDVRVFDQKLGDMSASVYQKKVQMIFQDPYGSLNPRKKVFDLIAEPLRINTALKKDEIRENVMELMRKVGLRPEYAQRYPHMFSGGQRQRICIARALVMNPEILVCDEPVSALDVSVQAQVINLLMELQDGLKLSYIFISHDLSLVRHLSDNVAVMYLGKIVEYGSRKAIFENPMHPYTRALLASTPQINRTVEKAKPLSGEVPSPLNPPTGCAFHKRCPQAMPRCSSETPYLQVIKDRKVSCHLYTEAQQNTQNH